MEMSAEASFSELLLSCVCLGVRIQSPIGSSIMGLPTSEEHSSPFTPSGIKMDSEQIFLRLGGHFSKIGKQCCSSVLCLATTCVLDAT